MIGRLPLNGWVHDRMIWLFAGMAVSVGANGALSTRTESTSDRVSDNMRSPDLIPSVTSVNESVSDNTISGTPERLSVNDSVSDIGISASLVMVSVSARVSESSMVVVPSIVIMPDRDSVSDSWISTALVMVSIRDRVSDEEITTESERVSVLSLIHI